MSFIEKNATVGKTYAPGWFLASEDCKRETRQIAQAGATSANGGKYQKMGSFYPANNSSTVEGILYEDVDVTSGDMPGSVVTEGIVYLDRLPAGVSFDKDTNTLTLDNVTINSSAGDSYGWDKAYIYSNLEKLNVTGDIVDTTAWTAWDGDDEITAASGKKIAIIVASKFGEAKAYGSATVVANT